MMWLAVAGGALLVLISTPIVIGMLLPERFTLVVERRIQSTPDVVFAALQDPEAYPVCATQCRGVTLLEPGEAGPRWEEDLGQTAVTYTVVEADAPSRLVVEARDSVVPLSYRSETTLKEQDGATIVTSHIEGRIASGTWHVPLFRLIIHAGGLKSGFNKHLEAVAKGVE